MHETKEIGMVWTQTRRQQNRRLLLLGLVIIQIFACLYYLIDTHSQIGITIVLVAIAYSIATLAYYLGVFNMASIAIEFLHRTLSSNPNLSFVQVSSTLLFIVFFTLPVIYVVTTLNLD